MTWWIARWKSLRSSWINSYYSNLKYNRTLWYQMLLHSSPQFDHRLSKCTMRPRMSWWILIKLKLMWAEVCRVANGLVSIVSRREICFSNVKKHAYVECKIVRGTVKAIRKLLIFLYLLCYQGFLSFSQYRTVPKGFVLKSLFKDAFKKCVSCARFVVSMHPNTFR